MNSLDILLSSIFVILATAILMFGLALSVIAVKNRRAVSKREIDAAIVVCHGVVSGRCQLICMGLALLMAALLYGQDLPLTAVATVYCGVVNMTLSTTFWLIAQRVAQYVHAPRISTYELM